MEKFLTHHGSVVTLDRANVDTDQMVPKQFLKRIDRTGFGEVLFYDWRYLSDGVTPNSEFEMNQARFQGATILLTRDNFGSGSSREHAVWAVKDYGLRVILAPSFADIFYGNCINNGILPIKLKTEEIDTLFHVASVRGTNNESLSLTVSLEECRITASDPDAFETTFTMEEHNRNRLLQGLDNVGLTLTKNHLIDEYEARIDTFLLPRGV